MNRPRAPRPQRVRVELRLYPAIAEALYNRAEAWNVSISEAGNRLLRAGLEAKGSADENY